MADNIRVFAANPQAVAQSAAPKADPCILVIFGASGDLTKRLLMPAFYNLACDKLLPEQFAIIGMAMTEWTSEEFRQKMTEDIQVFNTRKGVDPKVWDPFVKNIYYTPGKFDDLNAFQKLRELIDKLDAQLKTKGNILFYMATPPVVFGMISTQLDKAGFKDESKGWRRIIVEKPFGHDLPSALELNREILKYWTEDQIYRIDHYLGKETVQNILAFRFSNGIFETLWNKHSVDHIQFTVTESVGVEGRGGYYDKSGVLRDMMQNHMFQMLAYVCMEPPISFEANAVRNEKVKLLQAIRVYKPDEVNTYCIRGQYGAGVKPDGTPRLAYRKEPDVNPQSNTETFACAKLLIDNWRWEGVPIYLRSGKSLWKKGTEIIVQFKKAPEILFRGTQVAHLEGNRLIFHIQPDQGIELRFQGKVPGPTMELQDVNMRFAYGEAFRDFRGTGYEVLLYNAMIGDATLFSRTDLVETAWRIAQPLLDVWAKEPAQDFPNYPAGSWGPAEAFNLLERDGRRWIEILNREVLQEIPLFKNCDPLFLNTLVMQLKPDVAQPGYTIIKKGDMGHEMYIIARGEVEVIDDKGKQLTTMGPGHFFGEVALLTDQPRNATIRATQHCDLFVLDKADFCQTLRDSPAFAEAVFEEARARYKIKLDAEELLKEPAASGQ
ncbi:MAG: glucose-6-phosphate dehydrogenase [Gemmataceae bacterium]